MTFLFIGKEALKEINLSNETYDLFFRTNCSSITADTWSDRPSFCLSEELITVYPSNKRYSFYMIPKYPLQP